MYKVALNNRKMKKTILVIAILMLSNSLTYAQFILKNSEDVNWYQNLPQEQIYVHYNGNMHFAGEHIYYKVYSTNVVTNMLSENSKMAYVELVGKDGIVFRHRIRLDKGLGQSEYFIPTTVKTGHYKLIAYTQWMKNVEGNHFFESDISIINPYAKIEFDDSSSQEISTVNETNKFDLIKLESDKTHYGTREEVSITLTSLKTTRPYGNYSLSVVQVDKIPNPLSLPTAELFYSDANSGTVKNRIRSVGETFILPEFKGEMVSGKVYDSSGKPANGVEVALSVLSDEAHQHIVLTNDLGVFYFQILNPYSFHRAMIQVVGDNRSDYRVEVDEHLGVDYSSLIFETLRIHPDFEEEIIKRSVNNQIQTAYANKWQHELVPPEYPKPFYGNYQQTFILDDYKRFPTIAETLIEVVDNAWHERENGKQRFIKVRPRENDPYWGEDLLPMLVVDGALVQDHDLVMNFDANKVESISVLRDEYYFGDRVYQGAVYIKTFDNDFNSNQKGDFIKTFDLFPPQHDMDYYSHEYTNETDFSRIPDYRRQLFWKPDIQLQSHEQEFKFFTSDNKGTYRITFEGFTFAGEPISITKLIQVD